LPNSATSGLHDVEELHDHGGDAAEMAGAELALEDRHLLCGRIDVVALRLRVHDRLVGREQVLDPGGGELLAVGGEGARIACRSPRRRRTAGG
jgi:hypothetical protein